MTTLIGWPRACGAVWLVMAAAIGACTGDIAASPSGAAARAGTDAPRGSTTAAAGAAAGAAPAIPGAAATPGGTCGALDPGPAPLRRLTRFEYDNTVRDLLGLDLHLAAAFPAEEEVLGFDNNAAALGASPLLIEKYAGAAATLAARAVSDLPRLMGCDPARDEAACSRAFIASFGARAYRRPLASDEAAKLAQLYDAFRAQGSRTAAQVVVEAVLQSSSFLYRIESGVPVAGAPHLRALSPHETAARLAALLWASMPDDALFAAALANRLATADDVRAQARRMLGDPRARVVISDFARQWLNLDDTRGLAKDPKLFPAFDAEIAGLMADEIGRFFDGVVWGDAGDLGTLLTASTGMQNGKLARFVGEATVAGDAFQTVALDPARRAGLLTMPGLMATLAAPYQTSPIARGKFVRNRLLCEILPDPPPNVMATPPKPDPKRTTRERFAAHSSDPSCKACHQLLDPVGLGLEAYDAVGRWRTTENGKSLDVSGYVTGTDVEGAFTGGVELARRLAASAQVRGCVVRQLFRHGYGRGESDRDACTLSLLDRAFTASGGKLLDVIVALTQTPAFLYRPAPEGVQP